MSEFAQCLDCFDLERHRFQLFADSVAQFFLAHPSLGSDAVHSVKVRLKGRSNLEGKLQRKKLKGILVDSSNLFREITDLAGVRVFHLHNAQFPTIHREIMAQVAKGDWVLGEKPKAFSWDPESSLFYEGLGFEPEIRSTFYTSIHYLVRPSTTSDICCELQVRTLFEEIWGEIDHLLNYPSPTTSVACKEQLRALSKLVGTGSRLVDSIVRSSDEYSGLVMAERQMREKLEFVRTDVGGRDAAGRKSDFVKKRKGSAPPSLKTTAAKSKGSKS